MPRRLEERATASEGSDATITLRRPDERATATGRWPLAAASRRPLPQAGFQHSMPPAPPMTALPL
eukprot:5472836-Pyramimonas_sp.AAC.1